jgi:aspartate beta-hydroxylase
MTASLYDRCSDLVRAAYDRRIDTPALLDPSVYFPAEALFCGKWEQIRREALAVAEAYGKIPRFHELMAEQAPISANDGRDWRLFILKAYGMEIPINMAQCPELSALVRSRSEVLSASITFLGPRKHIPRHRGPFRGVLRFYLGLSVPELDNGLPAVRMVLNGQEHRLGNGASLLWDDTYDHEVWNDSDEVRIALFLDIWRPRMPWDMWLLSKVIVTFTRLAVAWRGLARKYELNGRVG